MKRKKRTLLKHIILTLLICGLVLSPYHTIIQAADTPGDDAGVTEKQISEADDSVENEDDSDKTDNKDESKAEEDESKTDKSGENSDSKDESDGSEESKVDSETDPVDEKDQSEDDSDTKDEDSRKTEEEESEETVSEDLQEQTADVVMDDKPVRFILQYDEKSFDELVTLKVDEISFDRTENDDQTVTYHMMYDVRFENEGGQELEPREGYPVKVQLEYIFMEEDELSENNKVTVTHYKESGEEEVVVQDEILDEEFKSEFELESFSPVGIDITRGGSGSGYDDDTTSATEDTAYYRITNSGGNFINAVWGRTYNNGYYNTQDKFLVALYEKGGTYYLSAFIPVKVTVNGVEETVIRQVDMNCIANTGGGDYLGRLNRDQENEGLSYYNGYSFYINGLAIARNYRLGNKLENDNGAERFGIILANRDGQLRFFVDNQGSDVGRVNQVDFYVKEPAGTSFDKIEEAHQVYGSGTPESVIIKPGVETSIVKDGVTYTFDGWYEDEACTIKADFAGRIETDKKYYGKYNPVIVKTDVKYYVKNPGDSDYTLEKTESVNVGTAYSELDFPDLPDKQEVDPSTGLNTLYTPKVWQDANNEDSNWETPSGSGNGVDTDSTEDKILGETSFYAEYVKQDNPRVTITKVVTGNMGDREQKFEFEYKVKKSDEDTSPITETVELKSGESVTFPIHYNGVVEVEESGINGYVTTIEYGDTADPFVAEGNLDNNTKITLDSITGDKTIKYTNRKQVIVPTGVENSNNVIGIFGIIVGVVGAFFVAMLYRRRRAG